jgi:hypothetical protein
MLSSSCVGQRQVGVLEAVGKQVFRALLGLAGVDAVADRLGWWPAAGP